MNIQIWAYIVSSGSFQDQIPYRKQIALLFSDQDLDIVIIFHLPISPFVILYKRNYPMTNICDASVTVDALESVM